MDIKTIRHHKKRYSVVHGLIVKNPILVQGLALAPAVIAATTLKSAVALCICAGFIFIPSIFAVSFIKSKQHVPLHFRILIYALISSIFYIPASLITKLIFPSVIDMLGIYMPLLVVNTIIVVRAEVIAVTSKPTVALLDSVFHLLGFSIAVLISGFIREYIGFGTIWGNEVSHIIKLPVVFLPFFGFILLGMLAALTQFINRKLKPLANKHIKTLLEKKINEEVQ